MHLLLTDRLTCPRCGPSFGLILLANRMQDRRVEDGVLGCPNCRDQFPIRDGFADLRAPPRGPLAAGLAGPPPAPVGGAPSGDSAGTNAPPRGRTTGQTDEGERLVALLGIPRGPGAVVLVGEPARHAPRLASAVEDLDVAAADADLRTWPDARRMSRIVADPGLPFFSGTLRGAAVDGRLGADWISEGARVVAPLARVVVTHAPEESAAVLERAGLKVLAAEGETVVAARS